MDKLQSWDPLGYGVDSYETEIVDVLQAVHVVNDISQLARKIQAIYEFSFEEIIPLNTCEKMAKELLVIKNSSSCDL
ncbi:DUF1871 family protein [Litchfieldia salsa]